MDPLPKNTDYDLPADAYVKKWLDDPSKPDSNIRDHVRDRWNGSYDELPSFEKAVEVELEKQTKARKKIAEFQQSIEKAESAYFVDRVSGRKD